MKTDLKQKLTEQSSCKTLRLILGDQLNEHHSWFSNRDNNVVYLIAELHQEASYVRHHIQKVTAFFCAMEHFAKTLTSQEHQVVHLTLDDTEGYPSLAELLIDIATHLQITRFEYQQPDEYRLLEQLTKLNLGPKVDIHQASTEHFLLPFGDLEDYFQPNKAVRMEGFYRKMRKRFNVLMEEDKPTGGVWNLDKQNRHSLKAKDLDAIPCPLLFSNNIAPIKARVERHNIDTIGQCSESLLWPVNRKQSLELLSYFCRALLPNFGRFQDAMTSNSQHSWSLYHSRLSFALNAKLLSPMEVIDQAVTTYEKQQDIDLAQVEGFVRQILGWREYIRGMYWTNMPDYQSVNALETSLPLPSWYWSGDTKMACMATAINQSLEYGYAHHIQRLMVTGNFALLAGINIDEIDQWYLGIYVDAIQWVELPNTRGMSQYADNGLIASKPYGSSANYINKMSDYCGNCHYRSDIKTGDRACPFNSLYWHFLERHKDKFERNQRMAMMYRQWHNKDDDEQRQILRQGQQYLDDIESI